MTESKAKKVIISTTVGAVLLLAILIIVMIYQIIAINVKKDEEAELNAAIAHYRVLIEKGGETLEARSQRDWIILRARELGLVLPTDIPLN